MTTGPALTEIPVPQIPSKETAFNSSRLLSKIARSPTTPSRRHLPGTNNESDVASDSLPVVVTQGAIHSRRNQPRPAFQRQISAPDTFVPPLLARAEEVKHHSDATGLAAQQAKAMLNQQQPVYSSQPSIATLSAKSNPTTSMFSAPLVSEHYPNLHSNALNGPNYMYQQLYELSQKRIVTLQYMRRTHEGKLFWFNTVQFSKSDISRLQSYTPSRLSRRATNYFLLGLSIPAVLDVHQTPHPNSSSQASSAVALEYLKSLNILFTEFENYQEKHPIDGTHVGSLSRARIPSMFKRSATVSRPRKSSSAPSAEIGAQISPPAVPDSSHAMQHSTHPSIDASGTSASGTGTGPTSTVSNTNNTLSSSNTTFSATATFPPPGPPDAPNSTLLPNEAPYTHLLTPPLPFAPDFNTVFSTLCDVLIETYQRLLQILHNPSACSATIMDVFGKADARIRRVMVGGIVKDFGEASREGAKRELAGVQKIVLAPLMG